MQERLLQTTYSPFVPRVDGMPEGDGATVVALSATRVWGRKRVGVANNGKSNPVVEPRRERCYSSKESSLQDMESEQSRRLSSFHARYVEALKAAPLTVKKCKIQS